MMMIAIAVMVCLHCRTVEKVTLKLQQSVYAPFSRLYLQFYKYFLSTEGRGCLAEGRERSKFWFWSIRFLRAPRGIFAVPCGCRTVSKAWSDTLPLRFL